MFPNNAEKCGDLRPSHGSFFASCANMIALCYEQRSAMEIWPQDTLEIKLLPLSPNGLPIKAERGAD